MLALSSACVVVLGLMAPGAQAVCLAYGQTIELHGKLSRQTFAEQPNYRSIADGDAQASYFFLSPDSPVCASAGKADLDEAAEVGVRILQLVLHGRQDFSALRPALGRAVSCRGELLHQFTGHHHSRLLLVVSRCDAG